jgi:hypothetical protein
MAADEPSEVANWVRERVLGSGGFGQVTLWRHKKKDEMIGEVQLHSYKAHLALCHIFSFILVITCLTSGLIYTGHKLIHVCTLPSVFQSVT